MWVTTASQLRLCKYQTQITGYYVFTPKITAFFDMYYSHNRSEETEMCHSCYRASGRFFVKTYFLIFSWCVSTSIIFVPAKTSAWSYNMDHEYCLCVCYCCALVHSSTKGGYSQKKNKKKPGYYIYERKCLSDKTWEHIFILFKNDSLDNMHLKFPSMF